MTKKILKKVHRVFVGRSAKERIERQRRQKRFEKNLKQVEKIFRLMLWLKKRLREAKKEGKEFSPYSLKKIAGQLNLAEKKVNALFDFVKKEV